MLPRVVETYDIYFNVQAKRRSLHVNGYCGTQQNSDICQVLKKSVYLQILRHHKNTALKKK